VLALSDLAPRQVAGRHQLGELQTVRAGDLHVALDGDVPERDLVQQVVEFGVEIVEADREVHVVVDREALGAVPLSGLVERRAAVAGAALHKAHVERLRHSPSFGLRYRAGRRPRRPACEPEAYRLGDRGGGMTDPARADRTGGTRRRDPAGLAGWMASDLWWGVAVVAVESTFRAA